MSQIEPIEQIKRRINSLTLRFADSVLERRYRDSQLPFRFAATKAIYAVGVLTWTIFTLLNGFTIRDPSVALFAVRMVAIVVDVVALAGTFFAKPGRWVEPVIVVMLAFNLVCLTLVSTFMTSI
jgi:hypothetical protein